MAKEIQELTQDGPHADWQALGATEVKPEKLFLSACNEDEEELKDPYLDYDDYCYRGKLVGSIDMLSIKLKDHPETELLYPATKPSYPRLSPSDTVALLNYALDPRLIKHLIICDYLNEDEAWFKQTTQYTYEPNQIAIEAKASGEDELTLFRPHSLENAYEPFDREWLTILKAHSPEAANAFSQVDDLEELICTNASLNLQLLEALWCYFGLILLSPQAATPLVVAEQNPIRTVVVSMAIKERLLTVPAPMRSARHEQILSRCNYMGGRVATDAQRNLTNRLIKPSQDQRDRISLILEFLQRTTGPF